MRARHAELDPAGPEEEPDRTDVAERKAQPPIVIDRLATVRSAAQRAYHHLASLQHEDGHVCGELEGCTILESEYMILLHVLGRGEDPRMARAAAYVREVQESNGGWPIYPSGPTDPSTSVKAYLVLKLAGDDPSAPHMRQARQAILEAGGLDAVNSYTKILLAAVGEYEWSGCPAIPPEMILLPTWGPFHIYEMSSWSRVIVIPLSIVWAEKPVWPLPEGVGVSELRRSDRFQPPVPDDFTARAWSRVFRALDHAFKAVEAVPVKPLRARALSRAESWMVERMELSDGIGAIFPPMVYSVLAMRCLGYAQDHPRITQQLEALERHMLEERGTLRIQPCKGPAWDTALALRAMIEHKPEADDHQKRAASWLLDHEALQIGDWIRKNPNGRPSGWPFQYENAFYPDCDDTAQVLADLARMPSATSPDGRCGPAARERALGWLLSMQSDDGGWGAFDKNCNKQILTYVPFADHNAMIDPSCADITGRTLDALLALGLPRSHPVVRRAVAFLRRSQEPDGSWYGRWGCNYIYGTWLALSGLAAAGEDILREPYRAGADWLRSRQNPDGGWGESLASYEEPRFRGQGDSTAAQTAWALLGLFASGDLESRAVLLGLDYLTRTQDQDGGWRDGTWTGTGFPKVFYLRYEYYERYFPLLALAHYEKRIASETAHP